MPDIDLSDYEGLFDTPANKKPLLVPRDAKLMPAEFSKSTMLALEVQQRILATPLDERDPHYRVKLAAQTQIATAQITAQLRVDEVKLKSALTTDYYEEIKLAIQKARSGS